MGDFNLRTVPTRYREVGDPGADIDSESFSLEPLLALVEKQAAEGLGEAPLPPRRSIADAGQFGPLAAGLPSDLLTRRPDILGAEQQLRAADADIGAARAAYFPRIALTGNFGYVSSDMNNLLSSGNQLWSIGAAVALPIFDAGRRSAQVAATQVRWAAGARVVSAMIRFTVAWVRSRVEPPAP